MIKIQIMASKSSFFENNYISLALTIFQKVYMNRISRRLKQNSGLVTHYI